MASYYVEHRAVVKRSGAPVFVQLENIHEYVGFRSVYAFTAETVADIKAAGSTAGLGTSTCYSDCLLLDFDASPAAAESFYRLLLGLGVGFEVYDSGNRSVHFHVPIEPMLGRDVPAHQKYWVQLHAPGADCSFYQKAGMYRLPGTFHVKNPGRCKQLVTAVAGPRLFVPELCPSDILARRHAGAGVNNGLVTLAALLTHPQGEGNRIPHMFRIIRLAQDLGQPLEDIVEDLLFWNENFAEPAHSTKDIMRWLTSVNDLSGLRASSLQSSTLTFTNILRPYLQVG